MINRIICLSFLILFLYSLSAVTFDWGLKYGAGVGSTYGEEQNYKLQYRFSSVAYDGSSSPLGTYVIQSKHSSIGLAQNMGLYFTFPIHEDVTNFKIQTEILWQHYDFHYSFDKENPQISDSLLAGLFNHSLTGDIETQIDYITIPVLFMLHQDITRDLQINRTRAGFFSYAGPSISFLVNHKNILNNGVEFLDDSINDFVATSQTDSDTLQSFRASKISSTTDDLVTLKYGFVIGLGWNLKELFQWGIGKDEWLIDFRFDFNINELGNSMTKNDFKLYSAICSIGYKF
jgi:hypothetical protein